MTTQTPLIIAYALRDQLPANDQEQCYLGIFQYWDAAFCRSAR